jgi:hypothetical protein
MQTLSQVGTNRKPRPAFNSVLDDAHGILTMDDDGAIWFRNSVTDTLTQITPAHVNFLSVNGEVGLSEVAYLADQRRGGPARIACSRQEGIH